MNANDKDMLKGLFQDIKLEEPSSDFESRLMKQVYIAKGKRSRKINLLSIFTITGGIIGILGIPSLIFWLIGFSVKENIKWAESDLTFNMPEITFDPLIISTACVALLLLVGDTLIRRRIWEKKHKN